MGHQAEGKSLQVVAHKEDKQVMAKSAVHVPAEVFQPGLSVRGIFTLGLYNLCSALQTVKLLANMWRLPPFLPMDDVSLHSSDFRHNLASAATGLMNVIACWMVLILHSSCLRMPKEQPYHSLAICMRIMVLLLFFTSLLQFWDLDVFHSFLDHMPDSAFNSTTVSKPALNSTNGSKPTIEALSAMEDTPKLHGLLLSLLQRS